MLLLLLSLAVKAAPVDPLGRMEELARTRLPAKCREIEEFVEELRKLQPLYEDPARFEQARQLRGQLYSHGMPKLDEFQNLHIEFQNAQTVAQAEVALDAVRSRPGGGTGPFTEASTRSLFRFKLAHEACQILSGRAKRLRHKIEEDEVRFGAAEAAHEAELARASRVRWALGLSVGTALFAACSLLLARLMAAKTVRRALSEGSAPQGNGVLPTLRRRALVMEPAPKEPESRALAGNIRLDRVIGQGGMGVVYEGTDLTLDRKVAVKRMRDEISENPRGLTQFLAEARLVAALKHPNIVEIYSILKEQGRLYLVFEYVEGETLDQALRVNKRLTLAQSLSVLRQAASALDYAHSRKVIHRDLKPSNIMLNPAGAARLMDFGIAYQAKKTIAVLTKAEKWGTPAFMSPEQELGSIGIETDLYALGVCFHAMLTGALPFPGPDHLAQKRAISLAGAELLPAKLLPVMKKVLSVDPGQRYHTGAELVAAVERA